MQGIFYTLLFFFFLYICSVFILSHILHSKGWIIQVVHQDAMGIWSCCIPIIPLLHTEFPTFCFQKMCWNFDFHQKPGCEGHITGIIFALVTCALITHGFLYLVFVSFPSNSWGKGCTKDGFVFCSGRDLGINVKKSRWLRSWFWDKWTDFVSSLYVGR